MVTDIGMIAAAIAVGMTGIGTAYAEAHIGAAGIGAILEKPESFSKVLILTVIPETIVVFGLVVAIILLFVI
mgnify:FL=1